MNRLICVALLTAGLLPGALVVTDLSGTQTQHVFSITGYSGACTIKVSETPTTYTPLHPDVDGTKYAGADTDTGRADTFVQTGGAHVVTIGHQLNDRALANDTVYYWQVSGCGGTASGTFTTPPLALQTTQTWPVPFDPNSWNHTAYPVKTFADTMDRGTTHVDPISGLKFRVASTPLDWTWRHPGWSGSATPFLGTLTFPYTDGGSGWTNPTHVVNGATSDASTTNQNPLDLYMGKFNDFGLDTIYMNIGPTLNDLGTKLYGSATSGVTFNTCIFYNPLDGCVSSGFNVTPPATSGTPAIVSASSDPEHPFPSSFPCAFFCGWGTGVNVPLEHRLTYGTLAVTSGVIALDTPLTELNHLSTALKNGNRIYLTPGSPSGSCPVGFQTIASLTSAAAAVLTDASITCPAGTPFVAMGFGIRITKSATAGTLNVGAEFKLAGSLHVDAGNGPTLANCGLNSFATGDTPSKQARICAIRHKGVNYYYFLMDDMTSRPMNVGRVPDSSYFTGTLGWSADDVPAAQTYSSAGCVPGTDARTWYCSLPNNVGGKDIYSLHYDGNTLEGSDFNYTLAFGGDSYILHAPSNNITWGLVLSSTNTLQTQIAAFDPTYNGSLYGYGFGMSGPASGNILTMQNIYNGGQNRTAWIAELDVSSGTGVLTALFHTLDGHGIGSKIRGGALHNAGPSVFVADTVKYSLAQIGESNTAVLHGGPFNMPITAVQRGGVWSTNTCLGWPVSDTTFCGIAAPDSDCAVLAPGNPYVANGGAGNNCVKVRFPHGGFCNTFPRSDEKATWPCPTPTTPIAGWTPANYSQPLTIQVGDTITDTTGDPGSFGESQLVAAYFPSSEGDGQDSAVLIRNSSSSTCCIAGYARADQTSCANAVSQGQHPNGWVGRMNVSSVSSCSGATLFTFGHTPSMTVRPSPQFLGGHADFIAGLAPGTATLVVHDGAMEQNVAANVFDIPFATHRFSGPVFHGTGNLIGSAGNQSYSASANAVPWFTDGNTVNNSAGDATENVLTGVGPLRDLIYTGTGNIWKIEVVGGGAGYGTHDVKSFFPIGWAGRNNLLDVSGPSSATTLANTPFGQCIPEVSNGECFAGSVVGATGSHGFIFGYVNVPAVYDPRGYCVNGVHYANIPCMTIAWVGSGAYRQQGWTVEDDTAAKSRFMTYFNDYPGSQYAYNQTSPLSSAVTWGPPTMVGGMGPVDWLAKLPTWYSGTAVAGDYVSTPISVPAGAAGADIQFGYSRFVGPDAAPSTAFLCNTRADGCSTSGSPYAFASESITPTSCASGCTISIPVMAPNVVYYRVRRTTNGGSTWTNGDVNVLAVSGVQIGPCSDLAYSPTTGSVGAGGGTGTVTLAVTDQTCASVNTSSQSWLTLTSATGGCVISGATANCTGNGTFSWSAAANVSSSRSAVLTPDSATSSFTLTETGAACTFLIAPTSHTYPAAGAGQSVTITASDSACGWIATYPDGWLTGPSSGTGTQTITVTAALNSGALRTSSVTIATQPYSAAQSSAVFSLPGVLTTPGVRIGSKVRIQ